MKDKRIDKDQTKISEQQKTIASNAFNREVVVNGHDYQSNTQGHSWTPQPPKTSLSDDEYLGK